MIEDQTDGHLGRTLDFARAAGAGDRLQRQLDRLNALARNGRCRLFRDFAPHSFTFVVEDRQPDSSWRQALNGGLIYSGPTQPLDGSGPAFCVGISQSGNAHDWSIHT